MLSWLGTIFSVLLTVTVSFLEIKSTQLKDKSLNVVYCNDILIIQLNI